MERSPVNAAVAALFALLGVFVIGGGAAQGQDRDYRWTAYINPLFGYSVEYPAALFGPPNASPNGDGISLYSPDGLASLFIFGFENDFGDGAGALADRLAAVGDIRRVTYRRVTSQWLVLSGYLTNGDIFYQRFEFNPDRSAASGFRISYPDTQRAPYDDIIAPMGRSLTPPRG